MNLADLFKKQQQDLETFKALRDKAWADMKERHTNLTATHGGEKSLPVGYFNQITRDIQNYHKEWAMETGTRYKDITAQHEKQRQSITGNKPEPEPQNQPKANNDNLSDKQAKLANLIKVQKAIAAKKMQNKPKQ